MTMLRTAFRHLCLWTLAVLVLGPAGMGCGPAATPTSTPTATPLPTPAVASTPTATPTAAEVWQDSPSYAGMEKLAAPFAFEWEAKEDVGDPNTWEYFRCSASPDQVSAFYRQMSVKPPYNWMEMSWVELPQGTMGIYFHTAFQGWLYRWVLPEGNGGKGSIIVVARRDGGNIVELPCCG